jgi:hypothetical protein
VCAFDVSSVRVFTKDDASDTIFFGVGALLVKCRAAMQEYLLGHSRFEFMLFWACAINRKIFIDWK